jgi:hypothetical protein
MARHLHTRVADDIRKACTHNGVVDTVQEMEMQMESEEYRNEIMGRYDWDDRDMDPADYESEHPDYDDEPEDDDETEGSDHADPREDFGWDGGMEP